MYNNFEHNNLKIESTDKEMSIIKNGDLRFDFFIPLNSYIRDINLLNYDTNEEVKDNFFYINIHTNEFCINIKEETKKRFLVRLNEHLFNRESTNLYINFINLNPNIRYKVNFLYTLIIVNNNYNPSSYEFRIIKGIVTHKYEECFFNSSNLDTITSELSEIKKKIDIILTEKGERIKYIDKIEERTIIRDNHVERSKKLFELIEEEKERISDGLYMRICELFKN